MNDKSGGNGKSLINADFLKEAMKTWGVSTIILLALLYWMLPRADKFVDAYIQMTRSNAEIVIKTDKSINDFTQSVNNLSKNMQDMARSNESLSEKLGGLEARHKELIQRLHDIHQGYVNFNKHQVNRGEITGYGR